MAAGKAGVRQMGGQGCGWECSGEEARRAGVWQLGHPCLLCAPSSRSLSHIASWYHGGGGGAVGVGELTWSKLKWLNLKFTNKNLQYKISG